MIVQQLVRSLPFVPVGIETYGAYGPQGIKLVGVLLFKKLSLCKF
jgi:hypothetical protein